MLGRKEISKHSNAAGTNGNRTKRKLITLNKNSILNCIHQILSPISCNTRNYTNFSKQIPELGKLNAKFKTSPKCITTLSDVYFRIQFTLAPIF